jgi:hypothetical protein
LNRKKRVLNIMKKLAAFVSAACLYGVMLTPVVNFSGIKTMPAFAQQVNGLNVKEIRYGRTGIFQQQADGSWIEQNTNSRHTYREIDRDEWSVYLVRNDGEEVQLDLFKKAIILNGRIIDRITASSSTIFQSLTPTTPNQPTNVAQAVNGRNVREVRYEQGGIFQQQANGSWIEKNRDGQFTFQETNRDEWSVYLRKDDGATVQLDLFQKAIILNRSNKLYDILSASSRITQPIAPRNTASRTPLVPQVTYKELRNPSSGLCLDSFGREGEAIMHPCHGQQGNQLWVFTASTGELKKPILRIVSRFIWARGLGNYASMSWSAG